VRVLVIPEDFLNDPETGCSKERTENGKMRKSQPRGGVGMKHLAIALVSILAFSSAGFADDDANSMNSTRGGQQNKAQDDTVIICNPVDDIWTNCPEVFRERLGQNSDDDTNRSSSPFGLWMLMPWHPTPAERVLDGYTTSGVRREAGA